MVHAESRADHQICFDGIAVNVEDEAFEQY